MNVMWRLWTRIVGLVRGIVVVGMGVAVVVVWEIVTVIVVVFGIIGFVTGSDEFAYDTHWTESHVQ